MASSMAGAFLWAEYSICTGLTGANTFSRGWRAARMLSQVSSTFLSLMSTTADTAAETVWAMVLFES